MPDVVELVLNEHARVRGLFRELQAAKARPVRLGALWAQLSAILLAHFGAVEEVFSLPLAGASPDHATMRELRDQGDEVKDVLAEGRLRTVGSSQWWLAVGALQAVTDRHISSMEAGLLPEFRRRTPEGARQQLGRQWSQFTAAFSDDSRAAPAACCDHRASGLGAG